MFFFFFLYIRRGKNVLNQKSELARAFEKQKEKCILVAKQEESKSTLANELQRVISERSSRQEKNEPQKSHEFNEEYLKARQNLRGTANSKSE